MDEYARYTFGSTTEPLEGCGNTAELQQQIATLRAQLAAAEARAERLAGALRAITNDRGTWSLMPMPLRDLASAALAEGEAG